MYATLYKMSDDDFVVKTLKQWGLEKWSSKFLGMHLKTFVTERVDFEKYYIFNVVTICKYYIEYCKSKIWCNKN